MPRIPTELDSIEFYLQQAARVIRDNAPGNLETEQLRTEIYKHIYEAIEICVRYAYTRPASARTGSPSDTRSPVHTSPAHSGGWGRGGGARPKQSFTTNDLTFAADLDLLK